MALIITKRKIQMFIEGSTFKWFTTDKFEESREVVKSLLEPAFMK